MPVRKWTKWIFEQTSTASPFAQEVQPPKPFTAEQKEGMKVPALLLLHQLLNALEGGNRQHGQQQHHRPTTISTITQVLMPFRGGGIGCGGFDRGGGSLCL
jgi:hypothetical protein